MGVKSSAPLTRKASDSPYQFTPAAWGVCPTTMAFAPAACRVSSKIETICWQRNKVPRVAHISKPRYFETYNRVGISEAERQKHIVELNKEIEDNDRRETKKTKFWKPKHFPCLNIWQNQDEFLSKKIKHPKLSSIPSLRNPHVWM